MNGAIALISLPYFVAGVDYTVNMTLLTFEILAGPMDTYCLPVRIVNDTVNLEGDETFSIRFMTLPEGVTPGSIPESVITINDNDNESKSILKITCQIVMMYNSSLWLVKHYLGLYA